MTMSQDGATRPLRVVLVEDHAMVRSAIRQAISGPDVHVVGEAATGEEALERVRALRPDLVLLDVDLPGMSGLQVLRELIPRMPQTKVVMLTASTARRDLLDAVRAGASGYLTKDLDPRALVRAVRGIPQGHLAMSRRLAADVVRHLTETGHGARAPDGPAALSEREEEVLRLLAEGLTDREIAAVLTISARTVETHVSNILGKLGVRNRAEAARRLRDQL